MKNIDQQKTKEAPIFIVGAQRSGTTLLRLLLNAHPDLSIPEEGTFLMPLLRKSNGSNLSLNKHEVEAFFNYLEGNAQFQLWGMTIDELKKDMLMRSNATVYELINSLYTMHSNAESKLRWGDKTPSFFRVIPTISSLFPNAKFIHIVRDGRDLYLSWKKMDKTKKNPAIVAFEWKYKVNKARSDLLSLSPNNQFEIRYEDLVSNPVNSLKDICSFCSLEYHEHMFDFWTKSENNIGKHHSELIFQGVSTSSIAKWKNLNRTESKNIRYFEIIAHDLLKSNNYEVSSKKCNFLEFLTIIKLLSFGLPFRIIQVFRVKIILWFSMKFGRSTEVSGGKLEDKK